jgi:hypothetical protein
MPRGRLNEFDVLKAFAALLIINSHLEMFHLRPWLSVDGMLGNTLFFFTTGFTLTSSLRRNPSQSMAAFLWKRLSRLYPALWIVTLLVPSNPVDWSSPESVFAALVYPTQFTFVRLIVPMYPVLYVIVRLRIEANKLGMLAGTLVGFGCLMGWLNLAAWPGPGIPWSDLGDSAWLPHFGGALLMGAWWSERAATLSDPAHSFRTVMACIFSCFVYAAFRIMALPLLAAQLGMELQRLAVLSLPTTLMVCLSLTRTVSLLAPTRLPHWQAASAIIAFLAAHSWETYLLHVGVAHWPFVSIMPYPMPLILTFLITFCLAPLLKSMTNFDVLRAMGRKN